MIVEVVKYNPEWIAEFNHESTELEKRLHHVLNQVYHIGSTAVPGLMAKPIIDIMLDVTSLAVLDDQSHKLKNMGYEVMGELGIIGRRYFRKGGDNRTHQIHAFHSGDANLKRHLAFRDYLIEHDSIAQEYGALKYKIAKSSNNDIEKYCDKKDPFIKLHEEKALNWYEKRQADDLNYLDK